MEVTACWVLAAALAISSVSRQAAAETRADERRAAQAKREADNHFEARRNLEAAKSYSEALELTRDRMLIAKILYNRARAHERAGKLVQALEDLERFEREAPREALSMIEDLPMHLAELRAKVSSLTIVTPIVGAKVGVRGLPVGQTPLPASVRIEAGPAVVSIDAPGHKPFSRDVVLPPGGTLVLEPSLQPLNVGRLRVSSSAEGASVTVDGRQIGVVPREIDVEPGQHTVLVSRADGRGERAQKVAVGAGQRVDLAIDPAEGDSTAGGVTSRWWFWTGIGVVVVGAGVGTFLALTLEKKPPVSTLGGSPQVRPALIRF